MESKGREGRTPSPLFFVSVAAKGLTPTKCRRESNWVGLKILSELEGLPGGRAWFAGHFPFRQGRNLRFRQDRDLRSSGVPRAGGRIVPTTARLIAYWYSQSRITCKWFGYCGIAGLKVKPRTL